MSSEPVALGRSWSLEIFRITSQWRQQRALDLLSRVRMPGVHAQGVDRPDGFFLVVDSASIAEEIRSRRIVASIDPSSTRVLISSPRRRRDAIRDVGAGREAVAPPCGVVTP
jgi:hypothetical protein